MDKELLSPHHLDSLHASAITNEIIKARGYRTITDAKELRQIGFSANQCRVPGLLLPLWTTDGQIGIYVYKPDNPRVSENRKKTNADGTHPVKVIKYEIQKNTGIRLDCPPTCQPNLANPSVPLWITEGQKKADALASAGLCSIALLGVWNFVGKNEHGGITFLIDWQYIALNGRDVHLVFDSDLMSNRLVQQALERLTEHLQRKGAKVSAVYLPHLESGEKVGIDDWFFAGHTVTELERLIDKPQPIRNPSEPITEILETSPTSISKPLCLINGHSYAATWLYVKTTRSESLTSKGEIVRHNPPLETKERQCHILRDDGTMFGQGAKNLLEDLGIDIHLPEIPLPEKLWSAVGVKKYVQGNRPIPKDVFTRVVNVVEHFIDFDRSLADQRTMAECIACYILSTWFLDSFNVIGFLWPNGDRGSGKTNLLTVITDLSYMGHLILAGGSFASLRDLADYGATLAFDDAENLSDPKKTDPDKRALLLAGNRRGVKVPVKEMGPDKNWHTRHVNAFCPRLFSAIRLPDPVLASRTIIIPLIRTTDRTRANLDPMDYTAWPCDRDELLSDLWAVALANLKDLPEHDTEVAKITRLSGRQFQPWRAILAVASWLKKMGVDGLFGRMEDLSVSYQNERPDFESLDITALTIRAMLQYVVANVSNVADVANTGMPFEWFFTTATITGVAKQIAEDSDGDFNPENITSQRIGHTLKKLRLTKLSRPRGQKARMWKIKHGELVKSANAYGIPIPEVLFLVIPEPSTKIGYIGDIGNIGYKTPSSNANDFNLQEGIL